MTNLFKRKNDIPNEKVQNNSKFVYKELRDELESKFPNYDFGELAFDECFHFICRNSNNVKEAIIISSILRQIEPTVEDVKLAYSLDDEYINNISNKLLPELRVLANNYLDVPVNNDVTFFPGFKNDFNFIYIELINRIEYLFELKRNINLLLSDKTINNYVSQFINNKSLLFLLNYLSVKDSLIIASSLDIIDIDDDFIDSVYSFSDSDLEDIFDRYIYSIKDELYLRIKRLESIDIETSYFDYNSLCNEYKDLLERISDTLDYLNNKNKKR